MTLQICGDLAVCHTECPRTVSQSGSRTLRLAERSAVGYRKKILSWLLWTGLCMGTCPSALAQSDAEASSCGDSLVKRLGEQFQLSDRNDLRTGTPGSANGEARLVAGICKSSPADTSKVIAALVYDDGAARRLLLAIVDGPGQRVISSYRGVIEDDAVMQFRSDSLNLDTARYSLSKTTRAFGLRLKMFHERCGYEGGYDDELTLYVAEGRRIRPVLTQVMAYWNYKGAVLCSGEAEQLERTDTKVTISVEPSVSHGFADLRLTASRSDGKKPVSAIVKYDGQRYDLKPWTAAFRAW